MYRRGQIFQELKRYEDAFLSFTKALSIPVSTLRNEILDEVPLSYQKALLLNKLL